MSAESVGVVRLWGVCPQTEELSDYDMQNMTMYSLLLEAESEGGNEMEMARVFFGINPLKQPVRAERVVKSHLRRAHWLLNNGFAYFLLW